MLRGQFLLSGLDFLDPAGPEESGPGPEDPQSSTERRHGSDPETRTCFCSVFTQMFQSFSVFLLEQEEESPSVSVSDAATTAALIGQTVTTVS